MKIALDYDGTFTADRELWRAFVAEALFRGHDVKIVTARGQDYTPHVENAELEAEAQHLGIEIVYTNGAQKQDVYGADIWIDDRPDMVVGSEQLNFLIQAGLVKLTPAIRYEDVKDA